MPSAVEAWGKPLSITVIQVYAPTTNSKEAEVEQFYEDQQDLLELTPQKYVLFKKGINGNARQITLKCWKSALRTLKNTGVSEGKCGMGQIRKDVTTEKW